MACCNPVVGFRGSPRFRPRAALRRSVGLGRRGRRAGRRRRDGGVPRRGRVPRRPRASSPHRTDVEPHERRKRRRDAERHSGRKCTGPGANRLVTMPTRGARSGDHERSMVLRRHEATAISAIHEPGLRNDNCRIHGTVPKRTTRSHQCCAGIPGRSPGRDRKPVRLLLDHCTPAGVRHHLQEHDVRLAYREGVNGIGNGELIRWAARAGYEVLITADEKMRHQQDMNGLPIGLVCLTRPKWDAIRTRISEIREAVANVNAGKSLRFEYRATTKMHLQQSGHEKCRRSGGPSGPLHDRPTSAITRCGSGSTRSRTPASEPSRRR